MNLSRRWVLQFDATTDAMIEAAVYGLDKNAAVIDRMTERELRLYLLDVAKSWIGYSEASGKFKEIIDLYNAQTPLPVGYKVKYTDEWCATYVSAVGIKAGLKDIILPECSCYRMVQLYPGTRAVDGTGRLHPGHRRHHHVRLARQWRRRQYRDA